MDWRYIVLTALLCFWCSTVFGSVVKGTADNEKLDKTEHHHSHHSGNHNHHHHHGHHHHHHSHHEPHKHHGNTDKSAPKDTSNATKVEPDVTTVVDKNGGFLNQLIAGIAAVFKKLWDTLKNLEIKEFKKLFLAIKKVLKEFLTSPSKGIKDLIKSIKKFWKDETAIYEFVVDKVNNVLKLLNLPALKEIFALIAKKTGLEIEHIEGISGHFWTTIKHILLLKLIKGLLRPLLSTVSKNPTRILNILAPLLLYVFRSSILDLITNLGKNPKLIAILGLPLLVVLLLRSNVLTFLLRSLLSAIKKLITGVQNILKGILQALKYLWRFLVQLLTNVYKGIRRLLEQLLNNIYKNIWGFLVKLLINIYKNLQSISTLKCIK